MPPLPRISSPVLLELARELRFAPAATLLRTVERAETLAGDIDPSAVLPGEWVVFRLTGYRPERWPEQLQTVRGGEVLASLSALTELLCDRAELTWEDAAAAGAVDRPALAKRWNVSQKTIDRLKAEGLIARRARRDDGKVVLAFMPGVIDACQRKHSARIAEATTVTRLTRGERARIIAIAARYRRWFGASLNRTAEVIAARIGRGHETIRELLRGEDNRRSKAGETAIFGEASAVQERSRRWMERAWRRGADPGDIARHARCGRPAVQRAINLRRHERLLELLAIGALTPAEPGEWTLPAGKPPGLATLAQLSTPRATTGLGRPGITDLAYFIETARHRVVVSPRDERTSLIAYHTLREAAAAWIRSTPRLNPQSDPIDVAETALRWASRIKAEIVRPLWTLAIETIETLAGDRVESLGAERLTPLLHALGAVLETAVDRATPTGSGRLAGAAALDLSTEASRWLRAGDAASAARAKRTIPAGVEFPDWTRSVNAWQAWLEPDPRIRPAMTRLSLKHAKLLTARLGWSDQRPLTLSETAAELGVSRVGVPRLERAAIREALGLVRSGS